MTTVFASRRFHRSWRHLSIVALLLLGVTLISCRDKGDGRNIVNPDPNTGWQLKLIHDGTAQYGDSDTIRVRVLNHLGAWPDVNSSQYSELRVVSTSEFAQTITHSAFIAADTSITPNGTRTPVVYRANDTTLVGDIVRSLLINVQDTLARDSITIVLTGNL